MYSHMRKHLSMPGLLQKIRKRFSYLKDPLSECTNYSLVNCLMSGLAIFGLKYPSLLQFDKHRQEQEVKHNLAHLYGVDKAPCDTYLRERLDPVNPRRVETSFKTVLSALQSSHLLENYRFMDGYYLAASDGTGVFYSDKVHCQHCCVKHHRDGRVSYYHQLLAASIVHPDYKPVFPLGCESILNEDGTHKNDCERNAAKRLITKFRQQHPKLKLIVVEDALYANAPHIRQLRANGMRHITNRQLKKRKRPCSGISIMIKYGCMPKLLNRTNRLPLNQAA